MTLVDPEWMWEHRDDPNVVAIGSSYEGFALGHIPGLVLPLHPWLKDTPLGTEVVPADEFAPAMAGLGVTEDTTIVVYDDFDGTLAARLWWVLRYYGHEAVRVLDGGWHRWVMQERPLSDVARTHADGCFVPSVRPAMACSTEELLRKVRTGSTTVVDVRPRDHWEGTDANLFGNKRLGRIAGSLHLDAASLITEDLRTLRSPDQLDALLHGAGVPEEGDVVFYCQAGVAAALGVLALHMLGRDDCFLYEGSMAAWANRDDTSMDVGAEA